MTRWLFVLVAACGGAAPPITAPTAAPVEVPLVFTDKAAITVRVEIDGHRFTFQLDTGASETAITRATWTALKLPHGARADAHGAGGSVGETEVVPLRELRVGGAVVRDLNVSVMALAEVGAEEGLDGILGQDVLGRYITEVDVPRHKLTLHPRSATAWRTPELVAIPYTETLGLIRLAGALDGAPIAAILDLGAAATIANTRAAPGAAAVPGASGVGADGTALAMAQVRGKALAIGDIAFGARDLYVSDLPVFADFGLADQPAVILGMDVLASHRLVIDPGAKRVYIARESAAGVPHSGTPESRPDERAENDRRGDRSSGRRARG